MIAWGQRECRGAQSGINLNAMTITSRTATAIRTPHIRSLLGSLEVAESACAAEVPRYRSFNLSAYSALVLATDAPCATPFSGPVLPVMLPITSSPCLVPHNNPRESIRSLGGETDISREVPSWLCLEEYAADIHEAVFRHQATVRRSMGPSTNFR